MATAEAEETFTSLAKQQRDGYTSIRQASEEMMQDTDEQIVHLLAALGPGKGHMLAKMIEQAGSTKQRLAEVDKMVASGAFLEGMEEGYADEGSSVVMPGGAASTKEEQRPTNDSVSEQDGCEIGAAMASSGLLDSSVEDTMSENDALIAQILAAGGSSQGQEVSQLMEQVQCTKHGLDENTREINALLASIGISDGSDRPLTAEEEAQPPAHGVQHSLQDMMNESEALIAQIRDAGGSSQGQEFSQLIEQVQCTRRNVEQNASEISIVMASMGLSDSSVGDTMNENEALIAQLREAGGPSKEPELSQLIEQVQCTKHGLDQNTSEISALLASVGISEGISFILPEPPQAAPDSAAASTEDGA